MVRHGFGRLRRLAELIGTFATSSRVRDQWRYVVGRRPLLPPPRPDTADFIDVRTLMATLSVEELARTADEYFRQHEDTDAYLSKPFSNVDDATDLLIGFSHVIAALRPAYGSTILDFGAGTCWSTRCLTQMGNAVIAVDVSRTALDVGRELFRRLPVIGHHAPPTFLVFDGRRFDVADASIDHIVCLNALHHVPNAAEVLREMARVLRPGGTAGFSEPGSWHSQSAQAQYEMRHFTVVENDIVIDDIERWALAVGFSRLEMLLFDSRSYRLSWADYSNLIDGGIAADQYVDFARQAAATRRAFVLYKSGTAVADSRQRQGLMAVVRVSLDRRHVGVGDVLEGEAEVVNTGTTAWLPSDAAFGPVLLGVHLFTRDGALINRDFHRVPLPHGIAPGESARFRFTVPAPPQGDFRLVFDLVSEHVCWFEANGSAVASLDVTVAPSHS